MLEYTDTLTALEYENFPVYENFTDNQWTEAHEMQKIILGLMFTKDTRDLFLSRMMRKPLHAMQDKISSIVGNRGSENSKYANLKYMLYSDHDD